MTVGDIKEKLGLKALCENEDSLSREVTGGYCGDLLSWVMSRAAAGDAWMTVMGNVNSIGVAALADIACIILTESAPLDEDARVRAEQTASQYIRPPKTPMKQPSACRGLYKLNLLHPSVRHLERRKAMGNEFEKAVKRFSEAKDVLEKFEKSEEAVAFMQNETGLPADECMRAYELIMNTDTD